MHNNLFKTRTFGRVELLEGRLLLVGEPIVAAITPAASTTDIVANLDLTFSESVSNSKVSSPDTYALSILNASNNPERQLPIAVAYSDATNSVTLQPLEDLREWSEIDYGFPNGILGTWELAEDGGSTEQTLDGGMSFFVGDSVNGGTALTAQLRIDEVSEEDDYVGVTFGFSTNAKTGLPDDYYLLVWKAATNADATAGLKLVKVTNSGEVGRRPNLWDFGPTNANVSILADGPDVGWVAGAAYETVITRKGVDIDISVVDTTNGITIWQTTAADPLPIGGGDVGFYTFGQPDVTFSKLSDSLPDARYRLEVESGTRGIQDNEGNNLDGNGDGTGGDDYVYDFEILAFSEDQFEVNDSLSRAVNLGFGDQRHDDLSLHTTGDEDWYAWTSLANGELNVSALFSNATGDLDVDLFDPEANLIASSVSLTDNEVIRTIVGQGDTYYIRVSGAKQSNYSLDIKGPLSSLPDADADGLPDLWETEPIRFLGDDRIDLDLPALGADPNRKDLFIEVDAMLGRGPLAIENTPDAVKLSGLATGTALDYVIEAFLNAPVDNPDGSTGINLHLEIDETSLRRRAFSGSGWDDFDITKEEHFGGADRRNPALQDNLLSVLAARRLAFRYTLFAEQIGGDSFSGVAELGGNDILVSLGAWIGPDNERGGTVQQQAGTFMHELGHALGLEHGGQDEISFKPNYLSVMNYLWQVPSPFDAEEDWFLDYSRYDRLQIPDIVESDLNEATGLGFPEELAERLVRVGPVPIERVPLSGPVDWNRDGKIDTVPVQVDINTFTDQNGDGRVTEEDATAGETLISYNDWLNLKLDFREQYNDDIGDRQNPDKDGETRDPAEFYDTLPTIGHPRDRFDVAEVNNNVRARATEQFKDLNQFSLTQLTLHEDEMGLDTDWFKWTAKSSGFLRLQLVFPEGNNLTVSIHDAEGKQISNAKSISQDTYEGGLRIPVTAGNDYFIQVNAARATEARYYKLLVAGPNPLLAAFTGTGGPKWSDARNWDVSDGSELPTDSYPGAGIQFPPSVAGVVDLDDQGQGRQVRTLEFLGSYEVDGEFLEVSEGLIHVSAAQEVILNATIGSDVDLMKTGDGTFVARSGVEGHVRVSGGSFVGVGVIDKLTVELGNGFSVASGESVIINDGATILGRLELPIMGTNSPPLHVIRGGLSFGSEAMLSLTSADDFSGLLSSEFVIATADKIEGIPVIEGGSLPPGFAVDLAIVDGTTLVGTVMRDSLPGDADRNGKVEFADFLILSQNFGRNGAWEDGDFSGDGEIGFEDFLLMSQNFGKTLAPPPRFGESDLPSVARLVPSKPVFSDRSIEASDAVDRALISLEL